MAYTLPSLDYKLLVPDFTKLTPQVSTLQFPQINLNTPLYSGPLRKLQIDEISNWSYNNNNKTSLGNQILSTGVGAITSLLSNNFSDKMFGDSELGRSLGTLFSSGISSTANTLGNNLLKNQALMEGLFKNAGASLAGAGAGIAANYLGKGITSAMGNSALGKGVGASVASGLGAIGGLAAANLVSNGAVGNLFKGAGAINPYGLAATVVGSALGATAGPSKEYAGEYGGITGTMDTIYDATTAAINIVPGWGQLASGLMTLNKGLSNVFGSTDGMTSQDAILGSAFMPAPVKWLNVWGSSKTGTFNNLSWLNSNKVNSFMGNSFGNLNDVFDKARTEAGKTYGTFSLRAKRRALDNINFANLAWSKLLSMVDKNKYQNIRSQYMSSINNLRYAQQILGGWNPTTIGKLGMKIFNNATNHNIGMRLLSGAALIDNKQMILCSATD